MKEVTRFPDRKMIKLLTFDHIYNQSIIPSTDVIQFTLTLKMTTAQVVETSVTAKTTVLFGTTFTRMIKLTVTYI